MCRAGHGAPRPSSRDGRTVEPEVQQAEEEPSKPKPPTDRYVAQHVELFDGFEYEMPNSQDGQHGGALLAGLLTLLAGPGPLHRPHGVVRRTRMLWPNMFTKLPKNCSH